MRRFLSIFTVLTLLALLLAGGVHGEPADGSGKGDWSRRTKTQWKGVSYRFICDGYDKNFGGYAMRFSFRNDASVPIIVTYVGTNLDGSKYSEGQYLESGEEAEKNCQGNRPDRSPCKIVKVRLMKPHG